jgi:hypothetical protein
MHGATLKIVDAKKGKTTLTALRILSASYYKQMPQYGLTYRLNKRKSAGRIVPAQSTAEDPLKMFVKKDRNM